MLQALPHDLTLVYYFYGMHKLLLLILFLFLSFLTYAQQAKGWLIYFGQTQIANSKFSIHHEAQFRDHKIFGDHHQSLVRVAGQYRFNPSFQTSLGYGFFYSELEGSPNSPLNEHRIYQELMINTPVLNSSIRHRIRTEQRFIDGADFAARFRYSLFADIPLNDRGFSKGGTYLAFYDEVFLNAIKQKQQNVFDRNRLYGGFGYKVKSNLGVQLGYMLQHVGRNKAGHHLLLSFHHQLKLTR